MHALFPLANLREAVCRAQPGATAVAAKTRRTLLPKSTLAVSTVVASIRPWDWTML
jgi:hypothetical protein